MLNAERRMLSAEGGMLTIADLGLKAEGWKDCGRKMKISARNTKH